MHVSIGTFRLEPSLLSLVVKFSEHTQSEFSLHSPLKHHDSSDIRIRDSFTTLRSSFTSCTFYLKRSPVLNTFHLYLLSLFLIFLSRNHGAAFYFFHPTDWRSRREMFPLRLWRCHSVQTQTAVAESKMLWERGFRSQVKFKASLRDEINAFLSQKCTIVFLPFWYKRAHGGVQQVSCSEWLLLWKQGALSGFFFAP